MLKLNDNDIIGHDKNEFRIVYIIGKHCIKINGNHNENIAEIAIYKELNDYCNMDIYNNNILKIHNCDKIRKHIFEFDQDIILDICGIKYNIRGSMADHDIRFLYHDTKDDLDSLLKSEYYIQYFITDYDSDYISICDNEFIKTSYKIEPLRLHGLFEKLYGLLIYLNSNIGFIHWDLHLGNLLLNINTLVDFKLFDFDLAETNLISNDEAFRRYGSKEHGEINIKRIIETKILGDMSYKIKKQLYGLAFDIIFFYVRCMDEFGVDIDGGNIKNEKVRAIINVLNGFIVTDDLSVVMVMQTPKLANSLVGILGM